jgi:phage-related baseplate assembly protein
VTTDRELRETAASLRRITELTAGLDQDSQADAAFRERLELAAEVLSAAGDWQSK